MISFRIIREAIAAEETPGPTFPYGIDPAMGLHRALRCRSELSPLLRALEAHARLARTTSSPVLSFEQFQAFATRGTRHEYEAPYFERRGRLLALVWSLVLDESDEAVTRETIRALEDLIWDICGEYTWCLPACLPDGYEAATSARMPPEQQIDLFAAETAHALAETLHLVGDRLDGWIGYRIRSEVERRIFRPLFHEPSAFAWESRPDNWAAVCGGAVGMAALLLEQDRERLAGMIDRVLRSLACFLEGFGEDGGCAEGISYWFYGFGYYVYFADMLFHYTEGRIDLLASAKVRRIAAYPAAVAFSGGRTANYADAGRVTMHTGLLSLLARRLGVAVPEVRELPPFNADGCYRWSHATRSLLWTEPALLQQPPPEGGLLLSDLAVAVDRRYAGGQMIAFSAKGGHNDEAHNHNDLGHFILHVGGDNLLADPGAGLYTREYFGPERYTLLHPSAEGHSVPEIGGRLQQAGRAYRAELLECEWTDERLRLELELAAAYGLPGLASLRRVFVWRWQTQEHGSAAMLELTDHFVFDGEPASIVEQFVSLRPPERTTDGYRWSGKRGRVSLQYDQSVFAAETIGLGTTDAAGESQTIYRLRLTASQPLAGDTAVFRFRCALL